MKKILIGGIVAGATLLVAGSVMGAKKVLSNKKLTENEDEHYDYFNDEFDDETDEYTENPRSLLLADITRLYLKIKDYKSTNPEKLPALDEAAMIVVEETYNKAHSEGANEVIINCVKNFMDSLHDEVFKATIAELPNSIEEYNNEIKKIISVMK